MEGKGASVAQQAWDGVGRSNGACSPAPYTRYDNKHRFTTNKRPIYNHHHYRPLLGIGLLSHRRKGFSALTHHAAQMRVGGL
ncbi:jg25804 [Pararge aegeria aegeria]|uniref:Jg25804 protein n=1 Tax=Pararge aegeria aegeria TaxID=348720 RepID=A0A8S4RXE2_9NEOP|nr:jg25804 [Pararge aegeria aegeria]